MWSRNFSGTRSRIGLLVGQFIVLLMVNYFIYYTYTTSIVPDKEAKETFRITDCFLISKKLSTKGRLLKSYRADFLISYHVAGVQYNRWVSGNGLDVAFFRNESEQENVLSQFEVGGTYPCWYNPENPQIAILVMRHNWLSTFPLMVPSVIGVIVLYYFLKNIGQLVLAYAIKTRENREEKRKQKKF